jgi:DICT domain-containing protein
VPERDESAGLSIGDIAARSGVAVGTLRMWESRYGFPSPERLPSGHRRYSETDLERVRMVVRARQAGLPLAMAIERARRLSDEPRPSVYGALRERFAHLQPHLLPKSLLRHISEAIEDECCARAAHPTLFGCFQNERFYRQAQARWRALARSAQTAVVLADFAEPSYPSGGPVEVPLAPDDPMVSEWVVVCDAAELSACLAAWERPTAPDAERHFETVWTVEPAVVREAALICCDLAARSAPEAVAGTRERLAERPAPPVEQYLRAAVELATRTMLYAAGRTV